MALSACAALKKPDGEKQINLTALKRIDEHIVEIVDNASQVALYKYCIQSNEWKEAGVEGSFFLYKRSCSPYHGFLIMNRMNTTNKVEPFISGLDFLLREPYLLYKNNTCNIFGIWFYNGKEFTRITSNIQQIVKAMKGKALLQRQRCESESALPKNVLNPVPSILSILSDAQMVYEKKNSQSEHIPNKTKPGLVENGDLSSTNLKSFLLLENEPKQSAASSHRQRFCSLSENECNFFQSQPISNGPVLNGVPKILPTDGQCCIVPEERNGNIHLDQDYYFIKESSQDAISPQANNVSQTSPAIDHEISSEHYSIECAKSTKDECVSGHAKEDDSCQSVVDGPHGSLYKAQLSQALIHLLSSESNMLAKIHRAYITSLNSQLKTLSSS